MNPRLAFKAAKRHAIERESQRSQQAINNLMRGYHAAIAYEIGRSEALYETHMTKATMQ